jgi:hypothetical protein
VQKQLILGSAFPMLAVVLLQLSALTGCGGSDGTPPVLDEVSTPVEKSPDNQVVSGNSSTGFGRGSHAEGSCDEDTVQDCRTPIAARDGFYLCGQGHRSCHGNGWTSCETHETSAGEDQWTPMDVGCDAPADRCSHEGDRRDCIQYLPPNAPGENNCYHGQETCTAGAWSTCIQTGS